MSANNNFNEKYKQMSNWTSGYVTDLDYTYGYYSELNLLHCRMALLNAGFHCPRFEVACELGFGQGISVNMHAAATGAQWHGTDFNPSQAGFAKEMAGAAGSGAQLHDEAFADFCSREELPDFDFIGLHGIWSWISNANREVIVEFIRRKLKVGGVLYISYNTLPGWASFMPMRHLMTRHAELVGVASKGIVSRIDGAVEFAQKLLEVKPAFARANPNITRGLEKIAGENRHYLAHEYFNKDWDPMHFATIAEWLAPAKLDFACSARYLDHFDTANLSVEQQEFLQQVPGLIMRQSVRDFMIDRKFRTDYWVKGGRRLLANERLEALRNQRVIMLTRRKNVSFKIKGGQGEVTMREEIYQPVLDVLEGHQPLTIQEVFERARAKDGDLSFGKALDAMMVLAGRGYLHPAHSNSQQAEVKKQTALLNEYLLNKARDGMQLRCLVSPVTGGGVHLGRVQQLFLYVRKQGASSTSQMVKATWQLLSSQGQRVIKDKQPLETEAENIEELTRLAQQYADEQAPILRAARIA